jgi:ABC-2 type transport system ATP-binding protein
MIQFNNVTRYYGTLRALHDVSFTAEKGEVIGLLGLNGAGKSTALKILAGLIPPSSGRVTIDGSDPSEDSSSLSKSIGFLPEEPPLYRDMTVSEFLQYVGQLKGMSSSAASSRVPEVIKLAGLTGRERQVISTLSHGFRKRVGIGMAVIHDPKLVLLDEPISGLDPRQIKDMRKVIRGLADGRAVMISSHILTEISKTCDRIVVIHRGELVASGTQAEIMQRLGNLEQSASRVNITVRGDATALAEYLRTHAMVKEVESVTDQAPFTSVSIGLDGDEREAVVADLITAGYGIRSVTESTLELEEAFLELTKLGAA